MTFVFEFKQTEWSQPETDDYEATDLTDAWNQFYAEHGAVYQVISVTDEEEGIHPVFPPTKKENEA